MDNKLFIAVRFLEPERGNTTCVRLQVKMAPKPDKGTGMVAVRVSFPVMVSLETELWKYIRRYITKNMELMLWHAVTKTNTRKWESQNRFITELEK
jgi:hypothetical protein